MRTSSLARPIGVMLLVVSMVACGGGDADPPAGDVAPGAPAVAPPAAPGAAPSGAAAGLSPALVEQGRQVYSGAGICFTCHGPNAEGTPLAPSLVDGEWLWIENPEVDLQTKLATVIRVGVPQPREYPAPMPPMGGASLSAEQIDAVSAFILSLNP